MDWPENVATGGQFCFLSSLPLLHGSVWLLPVVSPLLTNWLEYPYDRRGFVGAKKKTRVGLFVFNSLMKLGQDYIRMKSLWRLIVAKVFEVAWERGRIQFDEISPDPTVRHTIWTQVNIATPKTKILWDCPWKRKEACLYSMSSKKVNFTVFNFITTVGVVS
jgi:hypothetical protein